MKDDTLPSCQGGFIWDWCDQGLALRRQTFNISYPQILGSLAAVLVGDSAPGSYCGGNTGRSHEAGWCWGYGGDFGFKAEKRMAGDCGWEELHDGVSFINPEKMLCTLT